MKKHITLSLILSLSFQIIAHSQTFTGMIKKTSYPIKGQKEPTISYDKKSYHSDTIYFNYYICKDTLINERFNTDGSLRGKAVQIGKKKYIYNTTKHTYFFPALPTHPLAEFSMKDWKKTSKKDKKRGFEYIAVYPKNQNYKYYVQLDTSNIYLQQFNLKGEFSLVFHPLGIVTKSGATTGRYSIEAPHQVIRDEQLRCMDYLADFSIPKDTTPEEVFKTVKKSLEIIPSPERVKTALIKDIIEDKYGDLVTPREVFNQKITYIDVWASWCGPCRLEMPYLKKVAEKYKDDIQVISISIDRIDQRDKWLAAIDKLGMDWGNWILNDGLNANFCKQSNIAAIPRFLIIDQKGRIINDDAPSPSDTRLDDFLEKLLEKE